MSEKMLTLTFTLTRINAKIVLSPLLRSKPDKLFSVQAQKLDRLVNTTRFGKVSILKCFAFSPNRKAGVFNFFHSGDCFRKAPFSGKNLSGFVRISVDGRLTGKIKLRHRVDRVLKAVST